ncbi:MAG: adenine phosphoribosyltransferase, partial [Planctomycetes bacterium]|nr:adenine phosphoribosyltransferase [Planctomycetota bacterium]
VRKKGKLPAETVSVTYDLEYGTDTMEMHVDAVTQGSRVLMVDDLLATGGTMAASCEMVEKAGGRIVGVEFLIELAFLKGREKLAKYPVRTQIVYDDESP